MTGNSPSDLRNRLDEAIQNFDLSAALKLSDEIHSFEAAGGDLSPRTDRLWFQLTCMIESQRKSENT